jgi:hypothetical protein
MKSLVFTFVLLAGTSVFANQDLKKISCKGTVKGYPNTTVTVGFIDDGQGGIQSQTVVGMFNILHPITYDQVIDGARVLARTPP